MRIRTVQFKSRVVRLPDKLRAMTHPFVRGIAGAVDFGWTVTYHPRRIAGGQNAVNARMRYVNERTRATISAEMPKLLDAIEGSVARSDSDKTGAGQPAVVIRQGDARGRRDRSA